MNAITVPSTHVLPIAGGWKMVFWIDTVTGHLRHGAILRQVEDEVVVCYTRGQSFTLNVSELVPVPRFFQHDADAGAARAFITPSTEE